MENLIQIRKKYLLFREDARNLEEHIYKKNKGDKTKIVFLDFSCIDFMSRSFIDEFLNVLNELKMEGIEVKPLYLKAAIKNFISHIKKTKSRIQDTLTPVS